jgi:hypothetical protein
VVGTVVYGFLALHGTGSADGGYLMKVTTVFDKDQYAAAADHLHL